MHNGPYLVTFEHTNAKNHTYKYIRVVQNIPSYLLELTEENPEATTIPICVIPIERHQADMINGKLNGM